MKKFGLLMALILAAGVTFAAAHDNAAAAKSAPSATATKAHTTTHDVEGEFVAFDAAKKTLTVKTDSGESTAPVKGKALSQVKSFKAGDKVVVTCRDKADGTHEAAVAIKKAVATASK
jgi:hypothetical protein